ncbi:MAG: murein transglycosylase domain-containing protein [Bacteroidales bacterium]|jgi:membrane-bound lytic murein transglycosylase C|nr:murein transglycosylase domain-containing protein [Bacteroidales bacterium]MDY0085686.1 murein transglycosylase domain-containing protein [Bacteroidales bacterium]
MKKLVIFIGLLFFAEVFYAQETEDPFEQFRQQSQAGFDQFREETNKQWEAYEKANQEAFEQFKKGIEQKWGAGNFIESTPTNWVEYSEDGESRTSVDFEQEEARIEILMTPEEADNADLVKQKIAEAVKELALNKGKTKDYETEYEKPEPLLDEPVLKDQLQNETGETVTEDNLAEYAEQIVEQQPIEKEIVKPEPPEPKPEPQPEPEPENEKVIVSVKIPLATNSIQTRALRFYEQVISYSSRFMIDPALVFAVIHTESSFNPKAKSHVPAFGLMQIVPKYAGRDAYNYVYKEDKLLNENYLYESQNNIELGSAYLHMLITRSFRKVDDPLSRIYCAIAAYNTGAGNVSRAFIGTTKLYQAIPEINKMSADQVYEFMKKNLPYEETQHYIERVSSRMKVYADWLSD